MNRIIEKVFWKLFEAAEAIYSVTGAVLSEVEHRAQDALEGLNPDREYDPYWDDPMINDD